jgi:polar amino acid transport system substrate-binding protein
VTAQRRFWATVLVLFLVAARCLVSGSDAAAQQPAPTAAPQRPVLRVATGEAPPFVLRRGDAPTGFSIDVWNAITQRLGVQTHFLDLGRRSDDAQLEAVRRGEAEAAISAIVMTPTRERLVDFTIAYYDSGLQIGVAPDGSGRLSLLRALPLAAVGDLLAAGAVILVVLAHLLWLVERRENPLFQRGYLRGVGEGVWGVIMIIATGEFGDRESSRVAKRIVIAGMWLFGVVLIAQFTATVTSSLTVQQLQSSIRGPDDLPGKVVITSPGSIAAAWLQEHGLPFRPVTTADEALRLLRSGEAQAVVYDAPTLRYWAKTFGLDQMLVVGPVFHPEKYGIAVAPGSPLRKEINAVLLEMLVDGTYEEINRRWFSDAH